MMMGQIQTLNEKVDTLQKERDELKSLIKEKVSFEGAENQRNKHLDLEMNDDNIIDEL